MRLCVDGPEARSTSSGCDITIRLCINRACGNIIILMYLYFPIFSHRSVSLHRYECTATSPDVLTFERPGDKSLKMEDALSVAVSKAPNLSNRQTCMCLHF